MLKRIVRTVPKSTANMVLRLRYTKPNSPMPCDFSKVDKVTICGASNPLGQYLAFLLKRHDIIREIALHDECNLRGLALDLEHMNTKCKVKPNSGEYAIKNALRVSELYFFVKIHKIKLTRLHCSQHSDIVVITNGFDSSLDENEEKMEKNAEMIYKYGVKIASICPEAFVCIITPPVNIMVPIFSEVRHKITYI